MISNIGKSTFHVSCIYSEVKAIKQTLYWYNDVEYSLVAISWQECGLVMAQLGLFREWLSYAVYKWYFGEQIVAGWSLEKYCSSGRSFKILELASTLAFPRCNAGSNQNHVHQIDLSIWVLTVREISWLSSWNVNIAVLPAFSKITFVACAIMHGNEVFVMYGRDAELSIKWRTQPTASEGEGGST